VGGGGTTPVYLAGQVYVRDPGCTLSGPSGYVLDAATGKLVGRFQSVLAPALTPLTGFYTNSFGGGPTTSVLTATSLATGAPQWTWTLPAGDFLVFPPLVVNQQVYMVSSSGGLFALDAATGTPLWSTNVGASFPGLDGVDQFNAPLGGLNAGQGLLVIPVGSTLMAYGSSGAQTAGGRK
jgi:outer membrane protein assembly factor BamB